MPSNVAPMLRRKGAVLHQFTGSQKQNKKRLILDSQLGRIFGPASLRSLIFQSSKLWSVSSSRCCPKRLLSNIGAILTHPDYVQHGLGCPTLQKIASFLSESASKKKKHNTGTYFSLSSAKRWHPLNCFTAALILSSALLVPEFRINSLLVVTSDLWVVRVCVLYALPLLGSRWLSSVLLSVISSSLLPWIRSLE